MAANQKGKKSGPTRGKGKASARANAQNRAQATLNLSETPRVPRGNKIPSQSRFRGETPLTGEDRPTSSPGGKQHGYRQDHQPTRTRGVPRDRSPDLGAPPRKRRPSRTGNVANSPR